MRLAVFTNQFPGRVTTFFSRDLRGLLEAGFDIDVFAIYPADSTLWRYVPEILNEKQLPRDKVHHSSPMESFLKSRPWSLMKLRRFFHDTFAIAFSAVKFGAVPIAKSFYTFPLAWHWAQKFADNYDHVLAFWANYSGTCAYLFNRLMDRRIPFSIYPHAGIDLYRDQVYLRKKLLYSENIIVDCEFNKRFIAKLYPNISSLLEEKIHIYHPGLDMIEFPFVPDGRTRQTVVAVGRMVKSKGFDYLLMAAHELKKRNIRIEVQLVGDGQEASALKSLAGKLRIDEHVNFHGWLPPDQVREVVKKATVLVHPTSQLDDAVPNVIKEAMALGTPVIAADVAGIPELLNGGECGLLFPSRDSIALAKAIEIMLTDDKFRERCAVEGRAFAERKFDLWRNGRQLADILRSTQVSSNQKLHRERIH